MIWRTVSATDDPTHAFGDRPATMETPAITAVIALYNGAEFIADALESVFAQTLPPARIIVVDDGSTDDGPGIVRAMGGTRDITLLHKPNGGQSSARNLGFAHAHTPLVALLDQDDRWYPRHLEQLVKPFVDNAPSMPGWVYGNVDTVDQDGRLLEQNHLNRYIWTEHPKRSLEGCLANDMFVLPSATLVNVAAFDAAGGFDEDLIGYEDDDLFLRIFMLGYENYYVDEAISQWRIHTGSASLGSSMLHSRFKYFRKLHALLRPREDNARNYADVHVAWRFFKATMLDYQRASRDSDAVGQASALKLMTALVPHLTARTRLAAHLMLPVAHLMRVPPIGRTAGRAAPAVWAAYKRIAS